MERDIGARGKVFRDPVHGLIRIGPQDAFILDLIDAPEFQRLRRIRQLGVSCMTYPGAEHSRFVHSLGVFEVAQRILSTLLTRCADTAWIREFLVDRSRAVKAAALLHDVGHAPYSHLMERAFSQGHDHEKQSIRLITDSESGLSRRLGDAGIDPYDVASIIEKTSKDRLLVDIVSSQLDADRMDYLLRDSLHTGVEYGRYDARWTIRNFCLGRVPSTAADGTETSAFRLCLDRDRGLHSAEQLVMARLHMHLQVYLHPFTRGCEALLLNLIRLAGTHVANLPSATPAVVRSFLEQRGRLGDHEDWIRFDEVAVSAAIAAWADSNDPRLGDLRRLARAFLNRERFFRARSVDPEAASPMKVLQLGRALGEAGVAEGIGWTFDDGSVTPYRGTYASSDAARSAGSGETPAAESILLATGDLDDVFMPVERQSRILRGLDLTKQSVRRLYYERARADEIEPLLAEHGLAS